jgi:hypothetical protein
VKTHPAVSSNGFDTEFPGITLQHIFQFGNPLTTSANTRAGAINFSQNTSLRGADKTAAVM